MTPLGDLELAAGFNQFGVLASVVGGGAAKVRVDKVGEEDLPGAGAAIQGTKIAISWITGAWSGIALGVTVVINGSQFSPTEIVKIGDGRISRAVCERR